jgi:hypothetical protein
VSDPLATAELIEDRGQAAVSDEFFRSRPFFDAEGVTHTLRMATDGGELRAPVILKEIPPSPGPDADPRPVGPELDAISPYGYPGVVAPAGVSADPATVDFSTTGLVTVFIRHTLGAPPLSGASERNVVQIADPELPPKSRPSDRNQINKNLRRGYEVQLLSGPETTASQRAGFSTAYEETMRRTGASERYFFAAAYFDRLLQSSQAWLALARAPNGEIAAASIAVRSDGYLHYYLSGSTDSHLRDSPMKNVVASLIELSAEQGLPLNLGGGISPGDRLEEFKRGFANRELPWSTSEIVCDREAYARLTAGRVVDGFFPAYRAS